MNLLEILRIVNRNALLILGCAMGMAVVTYLNIKKQKSTFSSQTLINTGLVSGYNIESGGNSRIDFAYTNNEITNLIVMGTSYQVIEELSLRLLATCIRLDTPNPLIISQEHLAEIKAELGEEVCRAIIQPSLEETIRAAKSVRDSDRSNPLFKMLYSGHPLFGLETLQKVKVERKGNTDMIEMKYTCQDPGLCRLTLELLTTIIVERHASNKQGQSGDVLAYFEESTRKAAQALRNTEMELLDFQIKNRVINYYEQTRFIAAKKEDLDEFYYRELMTLVSADSMVGALEDRLKSKVNLPGLHRDIMAKRVELSNLSTQLTQLEIDTPEDGEISLMKAEQLKQQSAGLKEEIRRIVEETWKTNNSTEGLPSSEILSQWLIGILKQEESRARLDVVRRRQEEFVKIYDQYAPWGSTIKRIEREIDVNERAYLENLHSYNQARLHQINLMMSSNLKVVDKPVFPVKADKGKQMMFVIISFIAGLVVPTAILIAMHLMDSSLNQAQKAEEKTQLKVAASLPILDELTTKKSRYVNYLGVTRKAMEQMESVLFWETREIKDRKPVIGFFSTRKGEGKTWLENYLGDHLEKKGYEVVQFSSSEWLKKRENLSYSTPEARFIFVEYPGLLEESSWHQTIESLDLAFLVVFARKAWSKADSRMLEQLKQASNHKLFLFINGLPLDQMETVIGEVPKRRSFIRRFIKRMITLQFAGKRK